MSYQVINPFIQFVDPINGKPLSGGSVYFGRQDSDPKNQPANRINVYAVQDNGTEVLLAQPITLNGAGQPQYSGSVKQLKVELYTGESAYCVQVFSSSGSQKCYSARVYAMLAEIDGVKKSDLASLTSSVLIAGVEASKLFSYPKASALGIKATNTDAQNGTLFQSAVNTYGGVEIDLDFSYSLAGGLLLPAGGARIYCQQKPRTITWTGLDADYAISTALSGGSYKNHFENFTLQAASGAKKLFSAVRVRESKFIDVNFVGGFTNVEIRSSWYTDWIRCRFANGSKVAGSTGLYMKFLGTESFNVVNLARFESCQFDGSDDAVRLETGGEGVEFVNCGFEGNNKFLHVTGQGGGRNMVWRGSYIEGNRDSPIYWNKAGAGEFSGLVFEDNYFGTTSTARAGIIEFVQNNGGLHVIKIAGSTIRNFGGNPSTGLLLDVNGISTTNIYIEWFRNGFGTSPILQQFDKSAIDWRYIKTDAVVKLEYGTNPTTGTPFESGYSNGGIFASAPEFGTVNIWGTFKSVGNVFAGALNVSTQMPITMRPAALEKFFGATITDENTDSTQVTVMLFDGRVRTINLLAKIVSFSHTYSTDVNRRAVV